MTSIGSSAFSGCSRLKEITIGNSVTSIGSSAFDGCSGLTEITIPNSVISIGNYAFDGCTGLKKVTLEDGDSELSMGYSYHSRFDYPLFYTSSLEDIYIGRNLSYRSSDYAPFRNQSNLTLVTFGNSVTSIGSYAFSGCSRLTEITIGNSVTSIGSYAFSGCSGLTEITIGNSVTSIGSYAFSGCSGLTEITIGNSVTSIGSYAFSGCSGLTEITIPNSVISIGISAFSGCRALLDITLGSYVAEIGSQAFKNCPIATVNSLSNIPGKLQTDSFDDTTYNDAIVYIPSGTESIYKEEWPKFERLMSTDSAQHLIIDLEKAGTLLNKIKPSEVSFVVSLTLKGEINGTDLLTINRMPNIQSLDLGETTVVEGGMPYYEEDNEKWGTVSNELGEYWAYNLDILKSLVLPNTLKSLGNSALAGKKYLTDISISGSVTTIADDAFVRCTALREVTFADSDEELEIQGNLRTLFADSNITTLYLGRNLIYSNNNSPFSNKKSLCNLTLGKGLTTLNDYLFNGCTSLNSITIPSNITTIKEGVFAGCSGIKTLNIEESASPLSIGSNGMGHPMFESCNLEVLNLGRDIEYADSNYVPFQNQKSLSSLTFGKGVTTLNDYLFNGCTSLNSITIPSNITTIKEGVFAGCSGIKTLNIEESSSPLSIGSNGMVHPMFESCNLEVLNLGRNIEYADSNYAPFRDQKSLNEITITDKVSYIGDYLLSGCSSIEDIHIPESVASIGEYAFAGCSKLQAVLLPARLTEIANHTFYNCSSLTEISIPESVASIGEYAFAGCSKLPSVSLPDGLTEIANHTFYNCSSLTETRIPELVTFIGEYAFAECSKLPSVSLPAGLTEIANHTFYNCSSLAHIKIPALVTVIGDNAFSGCSALVTVEIPNFVISIGSSAFRDCRNLKSMTLPEALENINEYTFYNCVALEGILIPETVTSIGNNAFNGCTSFTEITIPKSVGSVGEYAFANTDALKSVVIEDSSAPMNVTNHFLSGDECKLTSLYWGRNLNNRDYGSYGIFRNQTELQNLTISDKVTTIPASAISGCTSLVSVDIPSSVKSIGESAFNACTSLENVSLSVSLSEIAKETFNGCTSLKTIAVPDPVTYIATRAFNGCTALEEATLPGSLREMASDVFDGCEAMRNIYVINPIPPVIESNTFESSLTSQTTLHVPEGSEGIYWIHPYWGVFEGIENWIVGTQNEFVQDGLTFHVTSEADATVEITAAALLAPRSADTEGMYVNIPAEIKYNGKAYRVTGIANNGFENSNVTDIVLPATLSYVGLEAFKGANALRNITCLALLPPSVYNNSFDEETYATASLDVDFSVADAYESDQVWGLFKLNRIETDVKEVQAPEDLKITVRGNSIILAGVDGMEVNVYDMNGILVRSTRDNLIENLESGIYIIRAGNLTRKIRI